MLDFADASTSSIIPSGRTWCPQYFLVAQAACFPSSPYLYASINHFNLVANLGQVRTLIFRQYYIHTFACYARELRPVLRPDYTPNWPLLKTQGTADIFALHNPGIAQ